MEKSKRFSSNFGSLSRIVNVNHPSSPLVLKSFSKVSWKIRIYETGLQLNASSISEFFTPDGVGVRVYPNSYNI